MEDCSKISIPSDIKKLGKNEEDDAAMERWSYASVVGMLLCLASNSRPDIVIKPSQKIMMDLYADTDFAGLWNAEDLNDPICTKSRTGILLTIGNVPLLWKSKLQTETALGTMESEYIALSQGMRELVSMRTLFDEIIKILKLQTPSTTRLSRVFKDSKSCQKLASSSLPKMTP